jgi:hypothetical protein
MQPHHQRTSPQPTTYTQLGKHRFRAPAGIIIDAPIPMTGGWVGIVWPNPMVEHDTPAWSRLCWEADEYSGRGWLIPERLGVADVIEFGSDPTGRQRWYGIVDSYEAGLWLTLQGPYPTPVEAHQAAQALIAASVHTPAVTASRSRTAGQTRCRAHTKLRP